MQGWSGFLPAPPFGAWHFLCPSQAKPTFQAHVKPQVFAASSPFRALFTPTFFPPESSWLHPVVPSSKEPASGRGLEEAGRPGEGAACHCRLRPSLPESCPEDPPLILCFWQERQPPPASQSRGWQQEAGQGRLHQAPTLLISLIRSKRQEAEGAPVALKSGILRARPLDSREPLRCGFS